MSLEAGVHGGLIDSTQVDEEVVCAEEEKERAFAVGDRVRFVNECALLYRENHVRFAALPGAVGTIDALSGPTHSFFYVKVSRGDGIERPGITFIAFPGDIELVEEEPDLFEEAS